MKNNFRFILIILILGILFSCKKKEKPGNLLNRVSGDASLIERSGLKFKDSITTVNYEKGLQELRNENLKKAKEYFLECLAMEPNNSSVLNSLGSLEANFKNFETSYKYFEKSLQGNPNNTLTYMSYGVALNKSDKQYEAIEIWKKGLKIEWDYEKKGYFNYNIANAFYKLDKYLESKKYNDLALKIVVNKEVRKDLLELKRALDKAIKL